jgi:hypothetical protein
MSDNWMPSTMAYKRIIRDLRYTEYDIHRARGECRPRHTIGYQLQQCITQLMPCLCLCLCLCYRCRISVPFMPSTTLFSKSKLLLYACYWYNKTFLLSHGWTVCPLLRPNSTLSYHMLSYVSNHLKPWNYNSYSSYTRLPLRFSTDMLFSDIIFTFELFFPSLPLPSLLSTVSIKTSNLNETFQVVFQCLNLSFASN